MPKGIIRIPEGITLPDELLEALAQRYPDYVLEPYSKKPDYQKSYQKKVDSLHRAFEFLLDACPRESKNSFLIKETLKSYADECKTAYVGKGESIEKLQSELKNFTAKIIDCIALAWNEPLEEATEWLNEAEQYVLMTEGRQDLATLAQINGKYVLQLDETLPPYYDEIIAELEMIKALNYPKTPVWFRKLAPDKNHYMQAYFCNLTSETTDLISDMDAFLETFQSIRTKAITLDQDLQQIAQRKAPIPAWFELLPIRHQELIRELATDHTAVTIEKKIVEFKEYLKNPGHKDNFATIMTIPQWYWVLPLHQQYLLQHALQSKENIKEVVSFLSSRHRTLPMPANFAAHSLLTVTDKWEFHQHYSPKYRSSHIATRDGVDLKWPQAVLRRHYLANLTQVMQKARQDQLILLQTLISPVGSEKIPVLTFLSTIIPDFKLNQMARTAVDGMESSPTIVQTNHPYNYGKYVLPTLATNEDVILFLKAVEPYAGEMPAVAELVSEYKNLLNTSIIHDYVGRELFFSSLEQLIILTIDGYSYGSCVSGKDRKAIESIHTDAMYLYKDEYGVWPKFSDTGKNRANFVSLVADLYITWHQQEHAGTNAPGSEGIKNSLNYFPADIVAEINRRFDKCLANDDGRATNNEVRKIATGGAVKADTLLCHLVAKQLGEDDCKKLYTGLYNIFGGDISYFIPEESRKNWTPRLFSMMGVDTDVPPEGIQMIRKLMDDKHAGATNVERMAKILDIILARPELDNSRTAATHSVYDLRYHLLTPDVNKLMKLEFGSKTISTRSLHLSEWPVSATDYIDKKEEEWKHLLEASKREYERNLDRFDSDEGMNGILSPSG